MFTNSLALFNYSPLHSSDALSIPKLNKTLIFFAKILLYYEIPQAALVNDSL